MLITQRPRSAVLHHSIKITVDEIVGDAYHNAMA